MLRCNSQCQSGVGNGHAHGAGGTLDHAHRRLDAGRVQVGHLLLGDLANLSLGQLANLGLVRLAGTALQTQRLLDENRDRRGLGDEGEGAVGVDGDDDRDDQADIVLRALVELLAEARDIDAVLAQGRADRRGRIGLAGGLVVMSYTMRLTCGTSLTIRAEIFASTS